MQGGGRSRSTYRRRSPLMGEWVCLQKLKYDWGVCSAYFMYIMPRIGGLEPPLPFFPMPMAYGAYGLPPFSYRA